MEFAQFLDGRVLGNPILNQQLKKLKDFDLAVKSTAYRSITADYKDFFIKEQHRIITSVNNHKINDSEAFFTRYISTNYRGLMKFYDQSKAIKPTRASFRSPDFKNNYKRYTMARVNYLLQIQLVIPLKSFIEFDFSDDLGIYSSNSTLSPTSFSRADITAPIHRKLPWKGNLNKLVTIFYELTNTELHNGEPVLDASPQEVAEFLFNNFLDKNAKDLSKDTIRTILKPARADKRSSDHKKYKIPS